MSAHPCADIELARVLRATLRADPPALTAAKGTEGHEQSRAQAQNFQLFVR
jgi:hypothetical protein